MQKSSPCNLKITLFYITAADQETAASLGHLAVDQRLAGCANIYPIQSIYPWDESIHHENEYVLLLKTIPEVKDQLSIFIQQHHPYEVPCILHWDVDVNDAYKKWIENNMKGDKKK